MTGSSVFSAVVNLFLTFSSAFLILKDFLRKRLTGGLTPLKPAQTPDKYEENDERNAIAAACAAAVPAAHWR
jgi:hypothetical protein